MVNDIAGMWDPSNMWLHFGVGIEDETGQKTRGFECLERRKKTEAELKEEAEAKGKKVVDIVKKSKVGLKDDDSYDPVATCNLIGQSLWEKVDMVLNDLSVASANTYYNHRVNLINQLNYNRNNHSTHLAMSGYYEDEGNAASNSFLDNTGLAHRASFTQDGKIWQLVGRLHHDLCSLPKVFPTGTKIGVKLHRVTDEQALIVDTRTSFLGNTIVVNTDGEENDGEGVDLINGTASTAPTSKSNAAMVPGENPYFLRKRYKLKVHDIWMECLRYRLYPDTVRTIENMMRRTVARYHYHHLELRTFYIPPGSPSHKAINLYTGHSPLRLFLVFLQNDEFHGSYNTNTLCYRHHNVSQITVSRDNRIDAPIYRPTWDDTASGWTETYFEFLKSMRLLSTPQILVPNLADYGNANGPCTVFGWDFASNQI